MSNKVLRESVLQFLVYSGFDETAMLFAKEADLINSDRSSSDVSELSRRIVAEEYEDVEVVGDVAKFKIARLRFIKAMKANQIQECVDIAQKELFDLCSGNVKLTGLLKTCLAALVFVHEKKRPKEIEDMFSPDEKFKVLYEIREAQSGPPELLNLMKRLNLGE